MSYIVAAGIVANEELLIRYSIGSIYNFVDEIVLVDHESKDRTLELLKELDVDKKITIINRKWDNNYSNARNTYLEFIKKNIWPKHRSDLYYWRIDSDEVYLDDWLKDIRNTIDDNPDAEGFRSNFYTFTQDLNHLDEKSPTESRVSIFRYMPDVEYQKKLHEWPVHKTTGIPLYASPQDDKRLGIFYTEGYAYLHYSWTDAQRCFQKAVNYTKIYVEQGTETKEHLETMTPTQDSWWWDKKSSIKYKGKLPSVFEKYGLLVGQENPETIENERPKFSVYTIIKNAIKFDYPILQAIDSILPIADEVIINCGDSDDGTTGLIHKAYDGSPKVKIFERKWAGKDKKTQFLIEESNWAKGQCNNQVCLYLQADEVYHEEDYEKILTAVKTLYERTDLMGAVFKWRHFDGLPTHINKDSYAGEVRLIVKLLLESIGDAQSMGVVPWKKQNVMGFKQHLLDTDIRVFHYGWLRDADKMLKKLRDFDGYYHNEQELAEMSKDDNKKHKDGKYNYGEKEDNFTETHPSVMYPRIIRYEKHNNLEHKSKFKEA